jgi:hypothetical protein
MITLTRSFKALLTMLATWILSVKIELKVFYNVQFFRYVNDRMKAEVQTS